METLNCVHSFLWGSLGLGEATIEERAKALGVKIEEVFCLETNMSGGSLYAAICFILKHKKTIDPLFFIRVCFLAGKYSLTLTGDRNSKYGESVWVVY